MINIVMFGPPGAGKGTQAQKLAKAYELIHLSTGDILRSEISKSTELGLQAKALLDRGELVPDEIVTGIIVNRFDKDAKGYVFDGFPRTKPQAEALDNLLARENTSITMMLSLNVPNDELITRILIRKQDSGRSDDADESIIQNRIAEYNRKTAPLIEYYSAQGKYFDVKGTGSIDEITQRLSEIIESNIPHV